MAGASCADKPGNVEELRSVVSKYYDGIRDHDHQKMTESTSDDFLLYEQGKVWNNDSVFNEMDKYPYEASFSFDHLDGMTDESTAHLSYEVQADFTFDDSIRLRYHFLESAAFVRSGRGWKMKFLHVTLKDAIQYDTIAYAPGYYAQRLTEFSTEPKMKGGIVFLGNSIVEYGDWRTLLNDPTAVNRGVAADNTFGVLRRLTDVVDRQPTKVFIEIGINDIAQGIPNEIILDNIRKIVRRIKTGSPGTRIYLMSILPTNDNVKNEYPDAFGKNHIIDEVNKALRSMTQEPFTYVDLNSALRDGNGQLDKKYAMPDGLHLSEEGYKVWADIITSSKALN